MAGIEPVPNNSERNSRLQQRYNEALRSASPSPETGPNEAADAGIESLMGRSMGRA